MKKKIIIIVLGIFASVVVAGGAAFFYVMHEPTLTFGPFKEGSMDSLQTTKNYITTTIGSETNKFQVFINGRFYGPYGAPGKASSPVASLSDNNWGILYGDGNALYSNVSGVVRELGTTTDIHSFNVTDDYAMYTVSSDSNDESENVLIQPRGSSRDEYEFGPFSHNPTVLSLKNMLSGYLIGNGNNITFNDLAGNTHSYSVGAIYNPTPDFRKEILPGAHTWGFTTSENYFSVNGGDPRGPFEEIGFLTVEGNSWGINIKKNGKWFVIKDEKEYGPYDYAGSPQISSYDNGGAQNWGFWYKQGQDIYAHVNDVEYGPYHNSSYVVECYVKNGDICTFQPIIFSQKHWGFAYDEVVGGRSYSHIVIDGLVYGPYQSAYPIFSGSYVGYAYQDHDLWYLAIGGKKSGPYNDVKVSDYSVSSFKKGNNWFVQVGDTVFGPYDSIEQQAASENMWGFVYLKDGKEHLVIKNTYNQESSWVQKIKLFLGYMATRGI